MVLKVKLLDESYLVVQVKRVQKECTVIHKVNDLMCMVVLVLPDTDFNFAVLSYTRVFFIVCGNFVIHYFFMLGLTALLSSNRISKRR